MSKDSLFKTESELYVRISEGSVLLVLSILFNSFVLRSINFSLLEFKKLIEKI